MSATIWLIAVALLLLLELALPMMVFVWFAAGALIVAIAAALGLSSPAVQLGLFVCVSGPLVLGSRTIFKKYLMRDSPGEKVQMNVDAMAGSTGSVIGEIDPVSGSGRVVVQGMDWAARSLEGEKIPVGTRVRVVQVEGVTLIVETELS